MVSPAPHPAGPGTVKPAIGVVLPTYNRPQVLMECLRHLDRQTLRDFEVIVVDDGSTDDTREQIEIFRRQASFPLIYLHQENAGAAAARNFGISRLSAPICVLIGDDIFPSPGFLEAHLDFHLANPEPNMAAIGYSPWHREGQVITPLMRWLENEGVQFAFRPLLEGEVPHWRHFYSSNLSVKASLLGHQPFSLGFRGYGVEDIELGYRLTQQHGLKMAFLPDAVAYHLHPATFAGTWKRARAVGASMYQFSRIWPEQQPATPAGWKGAISSLASEPRFVLPLLTFAAGLLTSLWCPNPLLSRVIQLHLANGYREAERSGTANGGLIDPLPSSRFFR